MFITWTEEKTTKNGTTTKRGTVQTRGESDDVFDVTMTSKPGNTHGVVGIKHGSETIVSRLLVPLKAPSGHILASIRRHADEPQQADAEAVPAIDGEDAAPPTAG